MEQLRRDPNVVIVSQTSKQFREALAFYALHEDKQWGLTDCASFLLMRHRKLTEALTHDHHFEQAGFKALRRNGD
jgi:predicted nucleic acid-binding protein